VDVASDKAAKIREVSLTTATPLRTIHGTVEQLSTLDTGEAWLRVFVREAPRAGLREEVQALLPRALEVRIDPSMLPQTPSERPSAARAGRSAGELFAEYLDGRGHADEPTLALFHKLYGEVA
jgi:exonuclease SbcD